MWGLGLIGAAGGGFEALVKVAGIPDAETAYVLGTVTGGAVAGVLLGMLVGFVVDSIF